MTVEDASHWLGLVDSALWVSLLVAEIIALTHPIARRPLAYRELLIAGLIGVLVWRCGLLITNFAVPLIPRSEIAIYLRIIDCVAVLIFYWRLGLIVRRCIRIA